MNTDKELMQLALEALENSVDLVREDAYQAEKLYGNYPTRQGKVNGLKVLADKHEQAITALREALAEQPAQQEPDFYGYASRLATHLWQKHYMKDAPQWKPFDDLMGVLTQIDNMTTGLTRMKQPEQEPVAKKKHEPKIDLGKHAGTYGGYITPEPSEGYLQKAYRLANELRSHLSIAPAQRKPLSPQSPCEMTQAERKMFKLGWLECEAAHGIGEKPDAA